jgi:hypothetical protein
MENMNKIIIISIFLLSIILTTIVFSILYVLTETNVGDWIVNLVIHPKLMYRNALFISGLIFSR